MRTYLLILTGIAVLWAPLSRADDSRIYFNNQDLFLNGLNLAWRSFANDIGPSAGTPDLAHFEDVFSQLEANGANCMRLWLHTNGANTPAWSGYTVTGPGTNTISDLEALLDLAWEHNVSLMLCLWSFDMLRESYGTTITDRSMAILTDPTFRQSYINNSLIPMVTALQGHPAILAWEIFNEPEGMSNEFGWTGIRRVSMANIQAFVNLCAGAIHRTDPYVLVTNGCWDMQAGTDVDGHTNYYTDARLIAAGGDPDGTLDFYCIHYYDWAGTAHSPFMHSASYWGLDKPLVIAEFYPDCSYCTADPHETLYQNGYAGGLGWSWTDRNPSLLLAEINTAWINHPEDIMISKEDRPLPPTCSITWPLNNIRIDENTNLTIHADASDTDGTITRVEFFEGINKLGEDTENPYEFTWNSIPGGTYTLTARATDSNDLIAGSPDLTLVVGGSTLPQETRDEAEDAAFTGEITIKNSSQASGGQYLEMKNGGSITWTVSTPAANTYDMTIGYRLAYDTPKTQYFQINGDPQPDLVFDDLQTTIWLEKTISVNLQSGINTLTITGYWSWMYFDYIELSLPVLCSEGDLNLDCEVNMDDLLILVIGWLNPYQMSDMADVSADWNL